VQLLLAVVVVVVAVVAGGSLAEHVWNGMSAQAREEEEEDEEGIDGQCGEKEEEKSAGDELRRTGASARGRAMHGSGIWGWGCCRGGSVISGLNMLRV